jgi:protein-S-isoprenylcysteine O-methyltransferase Ste14
MVKGIVFALVSLVIIFISWKSLTKPRSHGFYRFFALGVLSFLIATALAEEKENLARFGDEYSRYRKSTKMFIPGLL